MPLKKVAIFLMIIGAEKGQSIIALMDNGEIRAVISEIKRLIEVSQEVRESIWAEFQELGYEDKMKPSETLSIIRLCLMDVRLVMREEDSFFILIYYYGLCSF